jgi:hypothetical protein
MNARSNFPIVSGGLFSEMWRAGDAKPSREAGK